MPNHVKPTAEELEANAQKAAKEAEELANAKPDDPPTDPPVEPPKPPEKKEEIPEEPPAPPKEEKKEEKKEEPPKPPDYKEKFIASSKEAQILHAKDEKNQKLNKAIDEAAQITEIPPEVIKAEYPEWDDMTATEQRLAKENYINNKRFEKIHQASLEGKDIEEWGKKVDSYTEDPQTLIDHPELEGKVEDFKVFANKQSRRGVDFAILVSAFLHDETKTAKPKSKSGMFEPGSGGPSSKQKPKSDKMSFEDGQILKGNDFKKYSELLKAGKIEDFKGE